jgi:hypothetical protein
MAWGWLRVASGLELVLLLVPHADRVERLGLREIEQEEHGLRLGGELGSS